MMRAGPRDRLSPRSDRVFAGGGTSSPCAIDAFRREAVLEAAARAFAELGYRGTSARDILAAADIPGDTLYPYFADEETCFLGVLDRAVAESHARMAAATSAEVGWARQTHAAVRTLLEAMDAGSPPLRILLVEAPIAGAAAVARYDQVNAAAVAWMRRARRRYPEAARLPASFEQMVVDGVAFVVRRCLLGSPRPAMPELLDEISRYVIEPFVGPAEFSACCPPPPSSS